MEETRVFESSEAFIIVVVTRRRRTTAPDDERVRRDAADDEAIAARVKHDDNHDEDMCVVFLSVLSSSLEAPLKSGGRSGISGHSRGGEDEEEKTKIERWPLE